MAISELYESLKNNLDRADPNRIADLLRYAQLGSIVRALPTTLAGRAPAVSGYSFTANVRSVPLDENAPALHILRAYARAGTVTGELTVDADYVITDPVSAHIGIGPDGSICVLGTDAITVLDVWYVPLKCKIVEVIGAPATGVLAIPAAVAPAGVIRLVEAEVLTGSVVGKCRIRKPAAGLPATTLAQLDVAKANVQFNNATDAPTLVRAKLAVFPSLDLDAALAALRPF